MAPTRLGVIAAMLDNFGRLVIPNLGPLFDGLCTTLYICGCAFLLAVVLGLVACFIRMWVPYARGLAVAYIEFCRATPILVQLLWVNYVWPEVFGFPQTAIGAGILALALQSSGYLAETFRSGFEGLPKGQREAALAVGISRWRIVARIEAPQAVLVVAPLVINQLAVVVKSSTLVSVISNPDLMYQALKIVNQWYEPIEVLTTVALIYFVLLFTISRIANGVYARFQMKYGLAIEK
jgi:polar amino acid transport system permease protein